MDRVATKLLLYRGTRRERHDGTWVVPVVDFLRQLEPDAPMWAHRA